MTELAEIFAFLASQPLLAIAAAAVFLGLVGMSLRRTAPRFARLLRAVSNLGVIAALMLTIVQVARVTTGNDIALPQLGMPAQQVTGNETRIRMANDGHFWVQASVNGVDRRFLIDTGATLTAISQSTAVAAQIPDKAFRPTMRMKTANGVVMAEVVSIEALRFGNVVARDLDAIVAPGLGETNVIGMNLLSRLASWRVEGRTLILVPIDPVKDGQE